MELPARQGELRECIVLLHGISLGRDESIGNHEFMECHGGWVHLLRSMACVTFWLH